MEDKYKLAVAIAHGFIEALIDENGDASDITNAIGEAAKRYAVDILKGKTTAGGFNLSRDGKYTVEVFKDIEKEVNA